MPDDNQKNAKAAPAAEAPEMSGFLVQLRDALQGEAVAVQRRERDAISRLLAGHDEKRAKMPRHKLVAITDFHVVGDDGEPQAVRMGQEFEVSEFDLERYLGKGLPRADAPVQTGGVTVQQA